MIFDTIICATDHVLSNDRPLVTVRVMEPVEFLFLLRGPFVFGNWAHQSVITVFLKHVLISAFQRSKTRISSAVYFLRDRLPVVDFHIFV